MTRRAADWVESEFVVTDHRVMWTHVLGALLIVAGVALMFWGR